MGVDLQTYRCRIGCNKFSSGVDVVTLHIYIQFSGSFRTIGSVLFIGLLLLIAGIESNPGPRDSDVMDSSKTTEHRNLDQAIQSPHSEQAMFPTKKILATALPKDTDKECIQRFFNEIVQEVGKVTDIEINTANCSAVIEFDSQEGADFVLRHLCYTLNGQKLKVDPYSEDCYENASTDVESESKAEDILVQKQAAIDSDFNCFLDSVGLKELFPNKITIEHVIDLSTDVIMDKVSTLKELPWVLLKGIVFVNSKIIDSLPSTFSSDNNQETNTANNLDDLFDDDEYDSQSVSPFDILTVVLQCCDQVLKQLLYQKLYLCKKALPFINVRHTMSCKTTLNVWPLRSLQVESILSCHGDTPKATEIGVLNLPTKIVTFARFGRPHFSKSNLLNVLLSDCNANTFFSKECKYGSAERKFTQGLVEIAWLPIVGNKYDKFDTAITFLNCRGNVEGYSDENVMRVVGDISDVFVLVVDVNSFTNNGPELTRCLSLFRQSVLVIANPLKKLDKKFIEKFQNKQTTFCKTFKGDKERSVADMAFSLQETLCKTLKDVKMTKLEDRIQSSLDRNKITKDEDDASCLKGKSLAMQLIKQIECTGSFIRREDILPIQTKIAPELSRLVKSLHRSQTDNDIQRLNSEIHKLRRKVLGDVSPSVKYFVYTLIEVDSALVRQMYIEWLKILLNNEKGHAVSSLIQENISNKQKLAEMRDNSSSSDKQDLVQNIEKEIKAIDLQIENLSFNVEHLFRELGYIYDTGIVLNEVLTDKGLPPVTEVAKVVADFFMRGNALEFIDGDNLFLHYKWMEILFNSVSHRLGHNSNVLALSVLGLQSSGKSTFLNAMFGSLFRTSAGRCTKGITVQLLPVKQEKAQTTTPLFNFVLLFDTEGLRAPELCDQTLDHDNELATVITGLGDITFLNIMGENTSEINDILHVVVHAFLRLKLANENLDTRKRCYFIHQNVSSILASEKKRMGLEKFQSILDKSTKESAEIENIFNVSSFNEIIEFDINTHVSHMPNLWQGNPPMEYVNQNYSDGVLKFKSNILENAKQMEHKSYKSLTDTVVHAGNLWHGVLSEDFVFSFRNTLEIKAYVKLSGEFYSQRRELERVMNHEFITLSEKLSQCENEKSQNETLDYVKDRLQQEMNEKEEDLKRTMRTFIYKPENRELTEKWRNTTNLQIHDFCRKLFYHLKQETDNLYNKRKIDLLTLNRKLEEDFFERSLQVAKEFKNKKLDECDIDNKFEEIWSSVFTNENSHDTNDIRKFFHDCLFEKLSIQKSLLFTQLKSYDELLSKQKGLKSLQEISENIVMEDLKLFQSKRFRFRLRQNDVSEFAQNRLKELFASIDQILGHFCQDNAGITRSHVKEFMDEVYSMVNEFNVANANKFVGNMKFTIKVLVHVSAYANNLFVEHNIRCNKNRASILDQYKAKEMKIFRAHVDNRQNEEKAAIEFCAVIKSRVINIIRTELPGKIKTALCDKIPSEKYYLLPELLKDLANRKNFKLFKQYCENPKMYAMKWISEKAENHLFGRKDRKYNEIVTDLLNTYFSQTQETVLETVKECKMEKDFIDAWIPTFVAKIQNTYKITDEKFHLVRGILKHEVDIKCFKDFILERLEESNHELEKYFENIDDSSIEKESVTKTVESIIEEMWGCNEVCPFCGEPCALNKRHKGFKHYAIQHKPKGIRGFHKRDEKLISIASCNIDVTIKNRYYNCKAIDYICNVRNVKEDCRKGEHRFRDYKDLFPRWDIKPMTDIEEGSKFWMWFMATYKNEIAECFEVKAKSIPDHWGKFLETDAIESLGDVYINRNKQYQTNTSIEQKFKMFSKRQNFEEYA